MKKANVVLCIALLSIVLAGNVFAGGSAGTGITGVFDGFINVVVSFFVDDNCESRQCQTCRPREDGGTGTCRPTS